MTLDNFEEPQEFLLSEETEILRTLEYTAGLVVDLVNNIDESDIDNAIVSVNAGKLMDICEVLFEYAELYEDFQTDDFLEMAQAEKSMGSYKFHSDEEH